MQALLNNLSKVFSKYTEVLVGFLTVMIIGIIIIPMPSALLDLLLVINISMGVIILLLTLSAKNVLEFSTFPTMLLIATMFRLALNVSSTRLILSEGEADFYGAMDGASKFVKGDAIAGIIITLINLVGGILIFSIDRGMGAMEALEVFGKLTIGDGLVSQIPALLISVASGILVTRSADGKTFGDSVVGELFSTAQVLLVAAVVLLVISLVPAFPTAPFMIISAILGVMGYLILVNERDEEKRTIEDEANKEIVATRRPDIDSVSSYQVEPISVEIGYGLISLVDESTDDNLISQITSIRRQIASELGVLVNPIRIRDNLQLSPNQYKIKIKGNTVAQGDIFLSKYMVLDPGIGELPIEGEKTIEPAFGMPALWVDSSQKEKAELEGLTIVEPSTVFVTHLKETIKINSPDLLGRQEVKKLLEGIKEDYDVVIDELIPDIMTLGVFN